MALSKEQKKQVVENIKQHLRKQKAIFFIDFQGLQAKEIFSLRKKLKEVKGLLYVAKKNLIKIALKHEKISVDINEFHGQVGLVFGFENNILPAKTVYEIWEKHKSPEILGGLYEGEFINAEQALELAKLPPQQELQARLVVSISAPISNFVNVLQNNIKGLTFILKQIQAQ